MIHAQSAIRSFTRWLRLVPACLAAIFLLEAAGSCATAPPPPPPPARAEVRPPRPTPRAVWVPGHWKWKNRRVGYVWVPGHWRG